MLEIITEIIRKMIKNRKEYFKQIASIMFTIATIVLVECVSDFSASLSEYENNAPAGYSELNIYTDTNCSEDVLTDAYSNIADIIDQTDSKCIRIESDEWTTGSIRGLSVDCKVELYSFTSGWLTSAVQLTDGRNMTDLEEKYNMPVAVIPDNLCSNNESLIGDVLEVSADDNSDYELTVIGAYDNSDCPDSSTFSIYVNNSYLKQHGLISDQIQSLNYFVSEDRYSEILNCLQKYLAVNVPDIDFEINGSTEDSNENSVSSAIRIVVEFFLMVAFIVGNVGILTMSLIKVNDQIKMFGIKQAIGANKFHVGIEIATETILLSMIGTLFGIIIGLASGNLIGLFLSLKYNSIMSAVHIVIPVRTIGISAVCSAVISLIFSQIPVKKALKMNITEAIRIKD